MQHWDSLLNYSYLDVKVWWPNYVHTAIMVWICLISYNIVHSVYVLGGPATSSRLQWLYQVAMQILISLVPRPFPSMQHWKPGKGLGTRLLANLPQFASYRVWHCRFIPQTLNINSYTVTCYDLDLHVQVLTHQLYHCHLTFLHNCQQIKVLQQAHCLQIPMNHNHRAK